MSCENKCPFCPVNDPCKKPHCPYTQEEETESKDKKTTNKNENKK